MKSTMKAMKMIIKHLYLNASNYLLSIGSMCVISYVYMIYGFQTSLLLVGILLIIASIIIELNRHSTKK